MAAAEAGDAEKIRLLLNAGASVDAVSDKGDTALHAACKHAPAKAIQLLLEAGADATTQANDGTTPKDLTWERAQRGGDDFREILRTESSGSSDTNSRGAEAGD
jgi:ankyrin repeat protein